MTLKQDCWKPVRRCVVNRSRWMDANWMGGRFPGVLGVSAIHRKEKQTAPFERVLSRGTISPGRGKQTQPVYADECADPRLENGIMPHSLTLRFATSMTAVTFPIEATRCTQTMTLNRKMYSGAGIRSFAPRKRSPADPRPKEGSDRRRPAVAVPGRACRC